MTISDNNRRSKASQKLEILKEKALAAKAVQLQVRIAKLQKELRMAKYIASVYEEAEQEESKKTSTALPSVNRRDLLARQESVQSLDEFFEHENDDGFGRFNNKQGNNTTRDYKFYWDKEDHRDC